MGMSGASVHLLKRDSFFDEHDWNIFPNGIQHRLITSDQPAVHWLCDRFFSVILQLAPSDGLIKFRYQRHVCQADRLLGFGTAQNGQKILIKAHETYPFLSSIEQNDGQDKR
jgi:hypothetical protein